MLSCVVSHTPLWLAAYPIIGLRDLEECLFHFPLIKCVYLTLQISSDEPEEKYCFFWHNALWELVWETKVKPQTQYSGDANILLYLYNPRNTSHSLDPKSRLNMCATKGCLVVTDRVCLNDIIRFIFKIWCIKHRDNIGGAHTGESFNGLVDFLYKYISTH